MKQIDSIKKQDPRYIYQQTVRLINGQIDRAREKYDDLLLISMKTNEVLSSKESQQFILKKMDCIVDWIRYLNEIILSLNKAWQANSDEKLYDFDKKLEKSLNALYDWEVSLRSVIPNENWGEVFERFKNCTLSIIDDFEKATQDLNNLLLYPDLSGSFNVDLTIHFPPRLEKIEKLMKQACKDSLVNEKKDSDSGFWLELFKLFVK